MGEYGVRNYEYQSLIRLNELKCRLLKNESCAFQYNNFIGEMIKRGYAKGVQIFDINQNNWTILISNHRVFSEQKQAFLTQVKSVRIIFYTQNLGLSKTHQNN